MDFVILHGIEVSDYILKAIKPLAEIVLQTNTPLFKVQTTLALITSRESSVFFLVVHGLSQSEAYITYCTISSR